jgi:beta-glucosidase
LLFGEVLEPYIANGTVPEALLNDKITRILTSYFALDQGSLPPVDYRRFVVQKAAPDVNRKTAEAGFTLLKNFRSEKNARGLPLDKPKDLIRLSFSSFSHLVRLLIHLHLAVVGSAAITSRFGIDSNIASNINLMSPNFQHTGYIMHGYGSGESNTPYSHDPFTAIWQRVQDFEEKTVVDGYFSE